MHYFKKNFGSCDLRRTMTPMKVLAKIFFAAGIPFGILMGSWQAIRTGSFAAGIVGGLSMGAFFGAAMAALIGTLHWVFSKRVGGQLSGPASEQELELELAFHDAFERSVSALRSAGARIERQDAPGGVIEARMAMSWKSFGENVRVHLLPSGATSTGVKVSSKPRIKTTLVDYGKGVQNVERIATLLTSEKSAR